MEDFEARREKYREELRKSKGFWWKVLDKLEDIYYTIIPFSWREIELDDEVKFFVQRGIRGWSNRDSWGFDGYLAKVIKEGVNHLIEINHGHPCDLTEEEWLKILHKIRDGYELVEKLINGDALLYYGANLNKEFYKEYPEIRDMTKEEDDLMNEGMDLFRKYFFSLWD